MSQLTQLKGEAQKKKPMFTFLPSSKKMLFPFFYEQLLSIKLINAISG